MKNFKIYVEWMEVSLSRGRYVATALLTTSTVPTSSTCPSPSPPSATPSLPSTASCYPLRITLGTIVIPLMGGVSREQASSPIRPRPLHLSGRPGVLPLSSLKPTGSGVWPWWVLLPHISTCHPSWLVRAIWRGDVGSGVMSHAVCPLGWSGGEQRHKTAWVRLRGRHAMQEVSTNTTRLWWRRCLYVSPPSSSHSLHYTPLGTMDICMYIHTCHKQDFGK